MANPAVEGSRRVLSPNDALIIFREASTIRGPSLAEFAAAAGAANGSSSQTSFSKLADPDSPLKGYVLTPAGERRYRELVAEDKRQGPTWPTE